VARVRDLHARLFPEHVNPKKDRKYLIIPTLYSLRVPGHPGSGWFGWRPRTSHQSRHRHCGYPSSSLPAASFPLKYQHSDRCEPRRLTRHCQDAPQPGRSHLPPDSAANVRAGKHSGATCRGNHNGVHLTLHNISTAGRINKLPEPSSGGNWYQIPPPELRPEIIAAPIQYHLNWRNYAGVPVEKRDGYYQ